MRTSEVTHPGTLTEKSAPTAFEPHEQKSFILEGSILRAVCKLAVPIFISLFITYLYSIIDTFFISLIDRHSTALISGISLVTPIYLIFMALSNGLRIGISAVVARYIGEKNKRKLATCFSSGIFISTVISLLTLCLGYLFNEQIIKFIAGNKLTTETIKAGTDFLFYLLPGLSLLMFGQAFIGVLWGEGLLVPISIAMVISNILNVLLDPLFIFTFKLGVAGAGLATSLSIAFTAVFLLSYIFTKKIATPVNFKISLISRKTILDIIKISMSQAFNVFSVSLAFIILNNLVGSIGQPEMNSWGLCNRLDQFLFIPIFAVSGANLVLIGQNYGANNLERVRQIYYRNIRFAAVCLFLLAVIYISFSPSIFSLFSGVQAVIDGSVIQARIVTFSYLGLVLEIISTSTFQGIGRSLPAFLLAVIRMFCFAIPFSYLSVHLFHFDMPGIFFSLCLAHIGSAFIAFIWINKQLKNMRLRNDNEQNGSNRLTTSKI